MRVLQECWQEAQVVWREGVSTSCLSLALAALPCLERPEVGRCPGPLPFHQHPVPLAEESLASHPSGSLLLYTIPGHPHRSRPQDLTVALPSPLVLYVCFCEEHSIALDTGVLAVEMLRIWERGCENSGHMELDPSKSE